MSFHFQASPIKSNPNLIKTSLKIQRRKLSHNANSTNKKVFPENTIFPLLETFNIDRKNEPILHKKFDSTKNYLRSNIHMNKYPRKKLSVDM